MERAVINHTWRQVGPL